MIFGEASALTNYKVKDLFEKHIESIDLFKKEIIHEKIINAHPESKNGESFSMKKVEIFNQNEKQVKSCCC